MKIVLKAFRLRKNEGVTLIELLVAMAISAILIAAIYRTFISQQKTYTVQEQVVDMQQNVRVAINRMMREIRMAGFGNVSNILPPQGQAFTARDGSKTITFSYIINPGDNKNNVNQADDQITILGAFEKVSTLAKEPEEGKEDVIQLAEKGDEFDLAYRKYICIGGLETNMITKLSGNAITLDSKLVNKFAVGTPVYKVKAITYQLRPDNRDHNMPVLTREDNTDGGGSQVVAENIENLQFRYISEDGSESDEPPDPSKIRLVRVTVIARTSMSDPEFKGGTGGFRRRTITSNIHVRNMGLNP
jgi:prepilin-type N-terminal cleavage/methylation domain-containing protein